MGGARVVAGAVGGRGRAAGWGEAVVEDEAGRPVLEALFDELAGHRAGAVPGRGPGRDRRARVRRALDGARLDDAAWPRAAARGAAGGRRQRDDPGRARPPRRWRRPSWPWRRVPDAEAQGGSRRTRRGAGGARGGGARHGRRRGRAAAGRQRDVGPGGRDRAPAGAGPGSRCSTWSSRWTRGRSGGAARSGDRVGVPIAADEAVGVGGGGAGGARRRGGRCAGGEAGAGRRPGGRGRDRGPRRRAGRAGGRQLAVRDGRGAGGGPRLCRRAPWRARMAGRGAGPRTRDARACSSDDLLVAPLLVKHGRMRAPGGPGSGGFGVAVDEAAWASLVRGSGERDDLVRGRAPGARTRATPVDESAMVDGERGLTWAELDARGIGRRGVRWPGRGSRPASGWRSVGPAERGWRHGPHRHPARGRRRGPRSRQV